MLQFLRRQPWHSPAALSSPRRGRGSSRVQQPPLGGRTPQTSRRRGPESCRTGDGHDDSDCRKQLPVPFGEKPLCVHRESLALRGCAHGLVAPSLVSRLPGAAGPSAGLPQMHPLWRGGSGRPRSPAGLGLRQDEVIAKKQSTEMTAPAEFLCAGEGQTHRHSGSKARGARGEVLVLAACGPSGRAPSTAWAQIFGAAACSVPPSPGGHRAHAPHPTAPSTRQPQPSPNQNKIRSHSNYSETAALAALGIAIIQCSRKPPEQRGIKV